MFKTGNVDLVIPCIRSKHIFKKSITLKSKHLTTFTKELILSRFKFISHRNFLLNKTEHFLQK